MRGCLGCIWAPIAAIIAVLCWILGWLSWAIFKLIFICLWCFGLVVWCFASYPPAPATVDIGNLSGSSRVICSEVIDAAQRGDVGAQYALAEAYRSVVEEEDVLRAALSTMADVPEETMMSNKLIKAGEQAEYWYGKVADQGYMLARVALWKMTTARWERNIEFYCWAGQHLNDDDD